MPALRYTICLALSVPCLRPLARGDDAPTPARGLAPGETAADFTLRELEGRTLRLSELQAPAVVLAFLSPGCPLAKLYAPRLEALHARWRGRGVRFLGVSADPPEGAANDAVAALRAFATAHGLSFPLALDPAPSLADALAVERSPEVFVLDSERRLRYRGRVDDQAGIGPARSVGARKQRPEANYLEDALRAVLEGEDVATPRTEPAGCARTRPRGSNAGAAGDGRTTTFHADVEPILQARCQPCHRPGEIGPFPLLSFRDAARRAAMIREVVAERRMPPWHADPRHGVFANDRRLSEAELATILRWVDGGAPEGDPAQAPPPRSFPSGWRMGEPDAVFEMGATFQIPAEGTVPYRYTTVKTEFPEDRWVTASEVRPGDPSVVHHILVFCADPKEPQRWRRETGGGTKGYFAILVPGERPTEYPPGAAKRLPAGATLVFQLHYTASGKATSDRSRIGLRFAKGPIAREVRTRSAVNQLILIPPMAAAHHAQARHEFRRDTTILSLLPHMHLRGDAFRYELEWPVRARLSRAPDWGRLSAEAASRSLWDAGASELTWRGAMSEEVKQTLLGQYDLAEDRAAIERLATDGRTQILLDVPAYDFNWQSSYMLAQPLLAPRGARLVCTARYNNSPSNPALTREQTARSVLWGEQTWEEMLIGYFDCIEAER